jgi:hypothetical protein
MPSNETVVKWISLYHESVCTCLATVGLLVRKQYDSARKILCNFLIFRYFPLCGFSFFPVLVRCFPAIKCPLPRSFNLSRFSAFSSDTPCFVRCIILDSSWFASVPIPCRTHCQCFAWQAVILYSEEHVQHDIGCFSSVRSFIVFSTSVPSRITWLRALLWSVFLIDFFFNSIKFIYILT